MHLSNLPRLCVASILFNAQHFHAHRPYVRGGKIPNPVVPPSPEKLVGTNWQLKEIHGVPAIPEPQELFFETEGELSGYDGCNWFSGEWNTVQDIRTNVRPRIAINIGTSTLRMCRLTAEAGEQQSNFMSDLRQEAISFSLSADEQELTLYHTFGGNDAPIVMSRIPSPVDPHERLIGTDWVATGIVYPGSQDELLPVLKDYPITLSFSKDQIDGSTGTNQYFGDISKMTSMEFQVTNVGQTLMGWEENHGPRRFQEDAWMSILTTVNHETESPPDVVTLPYTLFDERIGDTDEWTQVLVLGSFQAPLARFVPLKDGMLQPPGPYDGDDKQDTPAIKDVYLDTFQLAGSNWRASNIRGALLRSDADVTMFFKSKTSVEGSGGCNQFDASWEKLGTLIQINGTEHPLILEHMRVEDLVPTKRYCDGMMSQVENYFFSGLAQESIFYEFNGEELTLWDAVMGEDGHQTRGMFIGRFDNVPVPSWEGNSLVGMTGDEAKAVIEDINPSLQVQIIPEGWMATADYRLDRVRIFVGEDGNVTREPQRG
eukprot:scaffold2425_cov76-Skeletonema_dohrnii-CCMP3373.AAC.35